MSTRRGIRVAQEKMFAIIRSSDVVDDVIKAIGDYRSIINLKNADGESALFIASMEGRLNIVTYLLNNQAVIDIENNNGATPLFVASEMGHNHIVKLLIEKGADINKRDYDGRTPFYIACYEGNLNVVKTLIKARALINRRDNEGTTPLFVAQEEGHDAIVDYINDHIARVKARTIEKSLVSALAASGRTAPAAGGRRSYTKRIRRRKV
jgi:ankyrin repeat protein